MARSKQVPAALAVLSALDGGLETVADIAKGTRSTPKQVRGALMSLTRQKLAKRVNPKARAGVEARYKIMAKGRAALKKALER